MSAHDDNPKSPDEEGSILTERKTSSPGPTDYVPSDTENQSDRQSHPFDAARQAIYEQFRALGATDEMLSDLSLEALLAKLAEDAHASAASSGDDKGDGAFSLPSDAYGANDDDYFADTDFWKQSRRRAGNAFQPSGRPRHDDRRKSRLLDEGVKEMKASSGLLVRTIARNSDEMMSVKVEIPKSRRAKMFDHDRLKLHEKVVIKLTPKFGFNKISSFSSTIDLSEYDIADDSRKYQTALDNFRNHLGRFDLLSIFSVPNFFDLNDGFSISHATSWTDVISKWNEVPLERCLQWQEWLNKWSSEVDEESDRWVESILDLSTEDELKSEISSYLLSIQPSQKGAITHFRILAKLVFERNQEAKERMIVYVTEFDIRTVDGQDVKLASVRLKALARVLGKDLPPNAVRRVLEGMAHASSPSFSQLCQTTVSLLDSSLTPLGNGSDTASLLLKVLDDLDKKYIELKEAGKWLGTAHSSKAFLTLEQVNAFVIRNGGRAMTPEQYRNVICHGCGDKGHIRPFCPLRNDPSAQARQLDANRKKGVVVPAPPASSRGRLPARSSRAGPRGGRFVAPGRPGATQNRRSPYKKDYNRLVAAFSQFSANFTGADDDDADAASDDDTSSVDQDQDQVLNITDVADDCSEESSSDSENEEDPQEDGAHFQLNTARAEALGVIKE